MGQHLQHDARLRVLLGYLEAAEKEADALATSGAIASLLRSDFGRWHAFTKALIASTQPKKEGSVANLVVCLHEALKP